MTVTSPNDERFGFHAQGYFRCVRGTEKPQMLIAIAIMSLILLYFCVKTYAPFLAEGFSAKLAASLFLQIVYFLIFLVLWLGVFITVLNIIMTGKKHRYVANDFSFTIYRINGEKEILDNTFYYSNIQAVEYREMYLLFWLRGYKVTITSNNCRYVYHYLFPKHKLYRSTESSPFFIIEEMAGLRKNTECI